MLSTGIFTILGSGKFLFATIFNFFVLDTILSSSPHASCADLFWFGIPAHIAWPSSAGEVDPSENPDSPFPDRCLPHSLVHKVSLMWWVLDSKGLLPQLFC